MSSKLEFDLQGVLFTVAGAFGIFVQVVAIRLLQRCLGETGIIIFSELLLSNYGICISYISVQNVLHCL